MGVGGGCGCGVQELPFVRTLLDEWLLVNAGDDGQEVLPVFCSRNSSALIGCSELSAIS